MSLRDAILNKLDVRRVLEDACGADVLIDVGNDWKTVCPFHDDTVPSMTVHKELGLFKCFACDQQGSIFDLYSGYHDVPFKDALQQLANFLDVTDDDVKAATLIKRQPPKSREEREKEDDEAAANRPDIPVHLVQSWHADLMTGRPAEKHYLHEKWGISVATMKKFLIGFDGKRYTLPVYDETGKIVNVRRYMPNAPKSEEKMKNFTQPDMHTGNMIGYGTPTRLYPMWAFTNPAQDIIITEGEKDCIVMHEHGFNAVTVTAGAAAWRSSWNELFRDRRVYICYDDDEAGKKGAEKVAAELTEVAGVYLCTLPKPSSPLHGYDITDFFQLEGGTKEIFLQVMADARTYSKPIEYKPGDALPVEVPLAFASMARYNGKPIITRAFVSGKTMAPYLVPKTLRMQCNCTDSEDACQTCPRWRGSNKNPSAPFKRKIELNSSNPNLLKLINCSTTQQVGYLREIAGIDKKCGYGKVEVLDYENIQQVILIPELDSLINTLDEMEYVSRTSYYIGHDIIPNRSYVFVGTTQPDPRTQYATHVFDHKDDMQDSIRSFTMTTDIMEQLKIFQPAPGQSIGDKLDDLYNFFWRRVHFIRGRPELQLGFDLVWHSVLNFTFGGQPVRKGWLEGLIIGDTSQGKTELTSRMRDYYNLGQRITGEKTSTAGLVGGLQKSGDQWLLQWGAYPQNDRRALLIDEYSSLKEEEIANMTDIRSTGIAEIVKIRTERTAARVRALLCSNLRSGELLRDTNQGINGVKELMGKNEDVRRLDFALTASTGEVPIEVINMNESKLPMYAQEYSAEACHNLVLWAWSRNRPPFTDQVHFTADAERLVREYAQAMGKKYHPRIPLVEPSDQRLKLARMATALACRLFSTEDGETVLVTAQHVQYISKWLQAQYDKPSMAYNTWSETEWLADRFAPGVETMIEEHIRDMPNGEDVVNFLARQNKSYRRNDIEAACNLDAETTRQLMYMLSANSAVRINGLGYRNQPCLINLIRRMKAAMPWPATSPSVPVLPTTPSPS